METHMGPRCAALKAAMEILGKPWNGLLLSELQAGPLRYSVLAERLAPIGDRMLSCRLKELEAVGLVERSVDSGPPIRVSYGLTQLGCGVGGVMESLATWGTTILEANGGTMTTESCGVPAEIVSCGVAAQDISMDVD